MVAGVLLIAGICSCGPVAQSQPATSPSTSPRAPSPAASAVATRLKSSAASWQLPAALSRMVVLADGSRLLIAGGIDASGATTRAISAVDVATGKESAYGTLAVGVHDAGGGVVGATSYIFGGGNTATTADVQSLRAGAPAMLAGRLPVARSDLVVVSTASEAFIVGGFDGTAATLAVLATGDGTNFRNVAALVAPVRYPAAAIMGDSLFVFGGEWAGGSTTAVQRVSLNTGRVDVVAHLAAGLSHAAAVVLGGRIWLLGGFSQGNTSNEILRFDPSNASVSKAGTLPQPTSDAGIAVVNGTAYLVGGENSSVPTTRVVALKALP